MRKVFTFSAALLMASVTTVWADEIPASAPAFKNKDARAAYAVPGFVADAMRNLKDMPTRQASIMAAPATADAPIKAQEYLGKFRKAARTVSAEDGHAFYNLGDGTYYLSVTEGFKSYYVPYLASQAYNATFEPVCGSQWNSSSSNRFDLSEYVDEDGNLCLNDYYVGGFYAPMISNDSTSYFAGSCGASAVSSGYLDYYPYGILYCASIGEAMPLSVFNVSECSYYYGYGPGAYIYGSSIVIGVDDNDNYITVPNDEIEVDFGEAKGGGLVVDHINFWGISTTTTPIPDTVSLSVNLVSYDEEGNVKNVYTGTISANDVTIIKDYVESDGLCFVSVNGYFYEYEEEDGFTYRYSCTPVLEDGERFCVYVSGFATPGVDLGVYGCYDDGYSSTTGNPLGYEIKTSFLADMGDGAYYYKWRQANAMLSIVGYQNCFKEYGTGADQILGIVGIDGGDVITSYYQDSLGQTQEYTYFEVNSTFPVDYVEVLDCPDWITSINFDTVGVYSNYSVILFSAKADALTEGDGREGDIVLGTIDEAATITFHIVQGTDEYISTDIPSVSVNHRAAARAIVKGDDIEVTCPDGVTSVEVYNAAGARVATAAVINGKATIPNAPAGLNLVNFGNGKSVKVMK